MDDLPEFELVIRAGAAFERTYPVLQGLTNAAVPFDSVTSGRAHVRQNYTTVVLFQFEVDIVDIDDNAYIRISATEEDTAAFLDWPSRYAQWDLEVTDTDEKVHMITDIGKIRIKPRITQ